jgi:hypothetical protein
MKPRAACLNMRRDVVCIKTGLAAVGFWDFASSSITLVNNHSIHQVLLVKQTFNMFRELSILGLSLLPAVLAQITQDWESGWDQTTWPIYAPDCMQGSTVSLDSTVAHSGKNSIKVVGAGGYCGHAFVGTNKSIPTGDVYVRTWV